MRRVLLLLAFTLALAGCDGGDSNHNEQTETSATATPSTQNQTVSLRVYFLRNGKVQPVGREVPRTQAVARASLLELFGGPDARERESLGATTDVPAGAKTEELSIADGIAHVRLTRELGEKARAQLVFTLTQFPSVRRVEFEKGSRLYARSDFEAQTPAIFIEVPLPFERVASPLHVFGTANTFEGTFNYELVDPDGEIVAKDVVTASSGTGTRGTFELTRSFKVDREGTGTLVVFELSAEDGSRTHVVKIPIRL